MPIRSSRPDAVVFDLDGTLVDSAPDLAATLNHMLAEHGRPTIPLPKIRHLIGDGAAKMIERGFAPTGGLPDHPAAMFERFLAVYEARIADETRPFPGVVATLERLAAAGCRLGVCTNKPSGMTRRLLDALDLSRHFAVVIGGDVPARKPDPRHLLAVLEQLGTAPQDAIMVGDSYNDVASAQAAKVKVVAVTFGYTVTPVTELGADALIERFDELPRVIGVA